MKGEKYLKLRSLGFYFGESYLRAGKQFKNKNFSIKGTENFNSLGSYFFTEEAYPVDYTHGNVQFIELIRSGKTLKTPDDKFNFNLDQCLFIDTETTGLSVTGGTFAFMVGLGWFEENHFKVKQFFLKDPDQEQAMLLELDKLLKENTVLVSYNGITFDIPILKARYRYHRLPRKIGKLEHVDLLKYARMVFRYQFEDRSLKSIEKKVIGLVRSGQEIPGYLAPVFYQNYLKTGKFSEVAGVFYHNKIDVVSLAAILKIINEISCQNQELLSKYETVYFSLGKHYHRLKNNLKAIEHYSSASSDPRITDELKIKIFLALGKIYKQEKNFLMSAELLEKAANLNSSSACIELAKIHEHQLKDLLSAKLFCIKALDILSSYPDSFSKKANIKDIQKRLHRINGKTHNG